MSDSPNYPDILGYLTGGARSSSGAAQVAAAVRPATVTPGQPCELIVLLQNTADQPLKLTLTLHLPRAFAAPQGSLELMLKPAEVGFAALPAAPRPGTSFGDYKLGVEVSVRATSRADRCRDANGGRAVNPGDLPTSLRSRFDAFQRLTYAANKRLGRGIIDVPLTVAAEAASLKIAPKARWVSLWTLADLTAPDLIARYRDFLKYKGLNQLRRQHTLIPLRDTTNAQFKAAGYPLRPLEAIMIAKLMALILEYAAPSANKHNPLHAGTYDLQPALNGGSTEHLPHWFRGLLTSLGRDERALAQLPQVVIEAHYTDLLRDAIDLAFPLVERHTGESIGTDDEMRAYRERVVETLTSQSGLTVSSVYMPLVIGGMAINDQIGLENENVIETLRGMWVILDERRRECDADTRLVIDLAEQVVERTLQAYGLRRSSL